MIIIEGYIGEYCFSSLASHESYVASHFLPIHDYTEDALKKLMYCLDQFSIFTLKSNVYISIFILKSMHLPLSVVL